MAKRRIMKEFKLNEISAVDFPAQEGARMTIMKRNEGTRVVKDKDGNEIVGKGLMMTSAEKGHAHLVDPTYNTEGGETSWATESGQEYGHTHPWIKNADGTITVGESHGHTHSLLEKSLVVLSEKSYKGKQKVVDAVPKDADEDDEESKEKSMTVKTDAEKLAEVTKSVEALTAANAVLETVSKFNDAEKAFYAGLSDEVKKAFLVKSDADRKSEVQAAELAKKDSNPIVYTADDGALYRKSDDPRLINMAKQADGDRKALAKAKAEAEDAGFAKRAETELAHLPGEVKVKVAVLKAVAGIADAEVRKGAEALLKANDGKLAVAFQTAGTADAGKDNIGKQAGIDGLDALAKKISADEKISYALAYTKAIETPEGKKLYDQSQGK